MSKSRGKRDGTPAESVAAVRAEIKADEARIAAERNRAYLAQQRADRAASDPIYQRANSVAVRPSATTVTVVPAGGRTQAVVGNRSTTLVSSVQGGGGRARKAQSQIPKALATTINSVVSELMFRLLCLKNNPTPRLSIDVSDTTGALSPFYRVQAPTDGASVVNARDFIGNNEFVFGVLVRTLEAAGWYYVPAILANTDVQTAQCYPGLDTAQSDLAVPLQFNSVQHAVADVTGNVKECSFVESTEPDSELTFMAFPGLISTDQINIGTIGGYTNGTLYTMTLFFIGNNVTEVAVANATATATTLAFLFPANLFTGNFLPPGFIGFLIRPVLTTSVMVTNTVTFYNALTAGNVPIQYGKFRYLPHYFINGAANANVAWFPSTRRNGAWLELSTRAPPIAREGEVASRQIPEGRCFFDYIAESNANNFGTQTNVIGALESTQKTFSAENVEGQYHAWKMTSQADKLFRHTDSFDDAPNSYNPVAIEDLSAGVICCVNTAVSATGAAARDYMMEIGWGTEFQSDSFMYEYQMCEYPPTVCEEALYLMTKIIPAGENPKHIQEIAQMITGKMNKVSAIAATPKVKKTDKGWLSMIGDIALTAGQISALVAALM